MNGDLGNLLTGEVGEAEARFSHEDFAGDYGRRIASRVRRRRTVRAAGVGGGTMLTAGALVLGATHMPWGTVDTEPGVGGIDCATPSPSVESVTVRVSFDGNENRPSEVVVMDNEGGTVLVRGDESADGTFAFSDAEGNPVEATPDGSGGYILHVQGASVDRGWSGGMTNEDPSGAETGTVHYTVEESGSFVVPSRSDDCYTPNPEDVVSPFQCGFTFPTESGGTDELGVVARVVSADDLRSEFDRRFGNQSPTADVGAGTGVWATAKGMPTSTGDVIATLSASDPAAGSGSITGGTASRGPGVYGLLPEGMAFVGARDGVVVATVVPGYDGATPGMVLDRDGVDADPDAFLVDRSALTACSSTAGSLDSLDLYAVAGYDKNLGLVYAWAEVPAP